MLQQGLINYFHLLMLLRLHVIAKKLYFLRAFALSLGIISLLVASYSLIVDSPFSTQALKPAIVFVLWGFLFYAFVQLFQKIPDPALPHDSFFVRLVQHIKLLFYSLLAVIITATSILLLWMSLRLLML